MTDKTKTMTAAEFRITREYLGLTHNWLAKHLDVNVRTIPRWESGESPIPGGVVGHMGTLVEVTADEVRLEVEALDPDRPRILTYRTDADYRAHTERLLPASWHRAVVARVRAQVPDLAVDYWTPDTDEQTTDR
jgi:hypothetical protein